jgi:hypothetical protein
MAGRIMKKNVLAANCLNIPCLVFLLCLGFVTKHLLKTNQSYITITTKYRGSLSFKTEVMGKYVYY